jgi:hypothetical protein
MRSITGRTDKLQQALLVVPFALFGLVAIGDALQWWMAVAIGVVTGLLCLPPKPWNLLGGVLLSFLVLAGVNVIAHQVHFPRLPIVAGLAVAFAIVAAVSSWLLHLRKWTVAWAVGVSLVVAFLLILGAPVLYGLLNEKKQTGVPESALVPSQLDLLIVTDGTRRSLPAEIPSDPALEEFEARYSVGYADGDTVRWTLVDSGSRAEALNATAEGSRRPQVGRPSPPPEDADTALVLFVDGTAPVLEGVTDLPNLPPRPDEVARWRRAAAAAAPPETPTFALLQTQEEDRLGAWKRFSPAGQAVALQALGSRTATDAAFRLAVGAPTSETDFALAKAYQPILLFDKDEPVPWMFSISDLFAEDRMQLCDDAPIAGTECKPIQRPRELVNGGTHLRVDPPSPHRTQVVAARARRIAAREAPEERTGPGSVPEGTPPPGTAPTAPAQVQAPLPGSGSAIYVHPVPVDRGDRHLLYLDYWWYLSENPVGVGGGALCGFGLYIVGVTCLNHQSDWEGITVVVDRGGAEPRPIAVQYGQHANVIRYDWEALQAYWQSDERSIELTEDVPGAATRPLAYIAKGTHATYPFHCGECNEVAHSELSEGPHRGGIGWVGNTSSACGEASCLQLLPTHEVGRYPALWNAYKGSWGDFNCKFKYYCDSGPPPPSPGTQGRYEHPASYDGTGDEQGKFVAGLIEE